MEAAESSSGGLSRSLSSECAAAASLYRLHGGKEPPVVASRSTVRKRPKCQSAERRAGPALLRLTLATTGEGMRVLSELLSHTTGNAALYGIFFPLQLFHVAYILIKFANSPRPDLWVLERSMDHGRTFTPWQYFARKSPCDGGRTVDLTARRLIDDHHS